MISKGRLHRSFCVQEARGAAPPPTPSPPLLRPSTPASVIALNHLRTFHDPDPPPLPPAFFCEAIQACCNYSDHFVCKSGLIPSLLHVLMVFILSHQHQASYFFIVFIVFFHHFHPHPFSSFSFLIFFIIFHSFHCISSSFSTNFIIVHYVSSLVIIVHQFSLSLS